MRFSTLTTCVFSRIPRPINTSPGTRSLLAQCRLSVNGEADSASQLTTGVDAANPVTRARCHRRAIGCRWRNRLATLLGSSRSHPAVHSLPIQSSRLIHPASIFVFLVAVVGAVSTPSPSTPEARRIRRRDTLQLRRPASPLIFARISLIFGNLSKHREVSFGLARLIGGNDCSAASLSAWFTVRVSTEAELLISIRYVHSLTLVAVGLWAQNQLVSNVDSTSHKSLIYLKFLGGHIMIKS